jgi:hypothetical protein
MIFRRCISGVLEREYLPRIAVKAIITVPRDGAVLAPGKLEVSGLAWSGEGPITAVGLSSDGGQTRKHAVVNARKNSRYAWVLWHGEIEFPDRGAVKVVCRGS